MSKILQVGDEGPKRYNFWTLTEEEKKSPDIIFSKFSEEQKPKEKNGRNHLKSMSCREKAEKSLDDFVNRCR